MRMIRSWVIFLPLQVKEQMESFLAYMSVFHRLQLLIQGG